MKRLAFLSIILAVFGLRAAPSFAKDQLRVAMAGFDGTDDVVFLTTQGARLFEKNGLKVELIAITGASPSSSALSRGEIDIDARSPVNAILAKLRGLDFTFVAATLNYLDYTIITRPGINAVGELKGKKVGIVRFGGKTDLLVRYLFRQLGLEPIRDFAMIQIGPPPARVGALQSGAIDASLFTNVGLLDEHGDRVLESTDLKPANFADREHFKVHARQDNKQMFIGQPRLGRVTGRRLIPMARRIN